MKIHRLFLASFVAAACICTWTETHADDMIVTPVTQDLMPGHAGDYLPARFAKDGQSKLTFKDFDEYTGEMRMQCVDGNLSTVAMITQTSSDQDYNRTYEGMGKLNMRWSSIQRDTLAFEGKSVEDFLYENYGKFSFTAKYCLNEHSSDGAVYMSNNASFKEVDGVRVPWWFFYYTDRGLLIEVKCKGTCNLEIIKPGFETVETRYCNPVISPLYTDIDNGISSLGRMTLTQTLFDGDPSFEYISPIYEEPVIREHIPKTIESYLYDNGSYFSYKCSLSEHHRVEKTVGFRLLKDNGNELQSIRFPDQHYAQGDNYMSILTFGKKNYLQCALDGLTVLYEINVASSSLNEAATFKTRIYPTVVESGQNVNIDFPDNNNNARHITVNNMSGTTVYSSKVSPGQNTTSIPASRMSKGMNIVTVSGSGNDFTSSKIIVK